MKATKRILCIMLALLMSLSATAFAVSADETPDDTNQLYKDVVFKSLGDRVNESYYYRCEYMYNADGSIPDEGETPDYIMAWISAEYVNEAIVRFVLGDYYFSSGSTYVPYSIGYCIYSFEKNRCYSLGEAWQYQLPNIDNALAKIGTHIDNIDNELTRYRKQVISLLGWEDYKQGIDYRCIYEYNADGSEVVKGKTPDYALVFAHTGPENMSAYKETVGDYKMDLPAALIPGHVVYSIKENKIYTIRQAYNEDLPNISEVLEIVGERVTLCSKNFEEYLKGREEFKEIENAFDILNDSWYSYKELYYYTDGKGSEVMPEATPDYVLISGTFNMNSPSISFGIVGDYLLYCENCGNPDCLRYYVCTPENDKVYTLKEAYDQGVEGIHNVFTDYGLGYLMGDADNDRKLTIKDATYIQKYVAKFEGIEAPFAFTGHNVNEYGDYYVSVADFDENNAINIKDATAIQKKLAKITE